MANNRLLLVEDDFDVAEMLLMYFRSIGYDVMHADHGAEGIQIARTKFPDIILLDVMLPDMDGYDICRRLRTMSLTKYIPTIFLTQRDERASKVKGLELGADDYITKPFDIDELRLRVEGSIRRATRENLHEPRTGLPTGSMVEAEIKRLKDANKSFQQLSLVLSGFNAYADVYSFMAANDVFYHAAKTIRDVVAEQGNDDDFVGMQGDTFVVVTFSKDAKALQSAIEERWDEQVHTFYTFVDADRGGIVLDEGADTERFVPIMRLTNAPEETTSGA
jgi:DNA-binding response OmpR family regulator